MENKVLLRHPIHHLGLSNILTEPFVYSSYEFLGYLGSKTLGYTSKFQTNSNPKWGGLISGCSFKEAQSYGKNDKDAHLAAVYRQRHRIAAHCKSTSAIQ